MSIIIKLAANLLLFFLITGCATHSKHWGDWEKWGKFEDSGRRQSHNVSITSSPPGAQIVVDGKLMGETPAAINLNYPVLASTRTKKQYEERDPGLLEKILSSPRNTKTTIASQTEERFSSGSRTYRVELIKRGYLNKAVSVSVPETSRLELTLQIKPVFEGKKFKIVNKYQLTTIEKVYGFFYDKRFEIDISRFEEIANNCFTSEIFQNPLGRNPDFELWGEITIRRPDTEIIITLKNWKGGIITTKKATSPTKNLETFKKTLESLIRSITSEHL